LDVSPARQFLFEVIMFPAVEKALSDVVDVDGIHKYFLASFEIIGYLLPFSAHHVNGQAFLLIQFFFKYFQAHFVD